MFTVAVSQAGQQMRPQAFSFMYFFIFFLDFVIYVISQFPHRSIAPGVLRTADVFRRFSLENDKKVFSIFNY